MQLFFMQVDSSSFRVSFLRSQNEKKDTFVLKEDANSWKTVENMCDKAQYTIKNRGHYVF